ncbi:MAG: hypothetical protein ACK58P_03595 [Betaproteobacteria bacterium]
MVTSKRFRESLADDGGRRLLDAGQDEMVRRSWPPRVYVVCVHERIQDVSGTAWKRRDRVDGRHLRHALAITLLPRREAGLELATALGRGPPGALAQVFVSHHDALRIRADHQQVVLRIASRGTLLVEGVEVLCRADGQFLDLALRDRRACELAHRLHDLVERRLGRFSRHESPNAVGEAVPR